MDGNPVDEQHVAVSLEHHKQALADVPNLFGSDRCLFSEKNVTSCKQQGVEVVCIPQRGGAKAPAREAYEKTREFKDDQRFRAGIEGHISVSFRGRGMKRCLAEGRERFELGVAAAVLANNVMKIAAPLTVRSSRRKRAQQMVGAGGATSVGRPIQGSRSRVWRCARNRGSLASGSSVEGGSTRRPSRLLRRSCRSAVGMVPEPIRDHFSRRRGYEKIRAIKEDLTQGELRGARRVTIRDIVDDHRARRRPPHR